MTSNAPTAASQSHTLSIIGAVLAVVSIFLLPIILGPIGAVFGFVGYARGDKPMGLYVGIGAIVCTIVGLVLSAVVFNATR